MLSITRAPKFINFPWDIHGDPTHQSATFVAVSCTQAVRHQQLGLGVLSRFHWFMVASWYRGWTNRFVRIWWDPMQWYAASSICRTWCSLMFNVGFRMIFQGGLPYFSSEKSGIDLLSPQCFWPSSSIWNTAWISIWPVGFGSTW